MVADMRGAGIHWPANAGGEHPNVETILGMPGVSNGCTLMTAESARFWYRQARAASPLVIWRAIPRAYEHKLPAQLGWDAKRVADECLNLWDEQRTAHTGAEWFLPLNELQFELENGAPFPGYLAMADNLRRLRVELRKRFSGTGVKLMFPAWVPQDDGDRLNEWYAEASAWDAVCVHCYGGADTMRARYQSYRAAFPNHPLFVGEWNSNHQDHDERESLKMWADVAATDPLFLGATYYIWETNNAGERDLSIWGNAARRALFLDPPVVSLPIPPVEPPVTEYEAFIRDAAQRRGIDPDIAVRVANSEGSVSEPARRGTFDTGSSWWAFQLHYGGTGYEYLGGTAGMGNGFTELTGWQPGDPAAWQDAARYALNRAKLNGWGAWYGAAHVGIGRWDGIDRNYAWNATSETWDYEAGVTPVPTLPYNPDAPCDVQPDDWSCSVQSTEFLLRSIGRTPGDQWIQDQLLGGGIVTREQGLMDASGAALADWISREYGSEMSFIAHNADPVTFDDVAAGAGVNPTIMGGRAYNHWVGVRRMNTDGTLAIANPAPGFKGITDRMSRAQFAALGPFSAVYIDRGAVAAPPVPVPVPQPTRAHVLVAEIRDRLEELAGLVA